MCFLFQTTINILKIFFTSQRLLAYLAVQNIGTIVTIRDNWTANCQIFNKKNVKNNQRDHDYKSVCVRWNDNCPVTVARVFFGSSPIHKIERRIKNKKDLLVNLPY